MNEIEIKRMLRRGRVIKLEDQRRIGAVIKKIETGKLKGLNIAKLPKKISRAKKGAFRIFFHIGGDGNKVVDRVVRRSDNTYKGIY